MREVVFVNKNTNRWKSFEASLEEPSKTHPDELAELFVQITDDLAYARTFYPKSRAVTYLNSLAFKAHQQIYLNRKVKKNRIKTFWTEEFPLIIYESRRFLLYSAIIFGLSVLIGTVSAANDDRFVRLILGDRYVNMTLHNIERGDPMAVYSTMNHTGMFFGITFNNMRVMFYGFILGIFASVGTVFILFQNGVMLGSFQYFFYEQGVLYESILSIWIHGTIEIFAIVVSGAAGLAMGNRLLFPGTLKRLTALRKGAVQGVKIAIGLAPFIVIAGFLEGYITRQTQWPDAVRIGIILASLALIIFYFFWYPSKLANRFNREINTLTQK